MVTFLLKLQTAAMQCSNVDYRRGLQLAADEVAGRIAMLYSDLTEDAMIHLNGAWARAAKMLKDTPPEGSASPFGGIVRPERELKAA